MTQRNHTPKGTPLNVRFAKYVDKSAGQDECWLWTGYTTKVRSPQGSLTVNGKQVMAKQISWELAFGPVPANHQVTTTCGESLCMNPAHLILRKAVVGRDYAEPRPCATCGKMFRPLRYEVERVNPQHCSKKCRGVRQRKPASRLWDRVDKSCGADACWLFTGSLNSSGYGHLTIDGKYVGAHRLAWELTNGPIPDELHVLHNCPGGDNPACCNPSHLFLGTHADNMADMLRKRTGKGTKDSAPGKLNWDNVREIRRMIEDGYALRFIARQFRVSPKTICMIRDRITWKDAA